MAEQWHRIFRGRRIEKISTKNSLDLEAIKMSENKLSNIDIKKLLELAKEKLGGNDASVEENIRKKGLEDERVKEILSDKTKLEKVLSSPQVQELIKSLKK